MCCGHAQAGPGLDSRGSGSGLELRQWKWGRRHWGWAWGTRTPTGARRALGTDAGHDKGDSRQGTWALLVSGAQQWQGTTREAQCRGPGLGLLVAHGKGSSGGGGGGGGR